MHNESPVFRRRVPNTNNLILTTENWQLTTASYSPQTNTPSSGPGGAGSQILPRLHLGQTTNQPGVGEVV
jgi:hypothetical protein